MGRADGGESTAKNVKFTVLSELVLAGLKFVSRRVFVLLLGKEYLGLNGLFTDILSMLSLAELGFGVSITYSLYGPVAREDRELIKSLIRLYRRIYQGVSLVVLAVGVSLTPFLPFFVREMPADIPNISLIYILNVVNASVSYLFTYKSTLLYVYQKKYIDGMIRAIVTLFATVVQIVTLMLTGNYVYYLYLSIGATLIQNIVISIKVDKRYPYLKEKKVSPLPGTILQDIRRNVSAMILHRIGSVAVFGTDNFLIAKFVGIVTTGLYSNYMMIRGFLNVVINALFSGITPVMGKLNATETKVQKQEAFRRLNFFAAWLLGWMSICLFWLYDPFIHIWLGGGYLLPRPVVFLIVVNFYVTGMRIPVANTRSAMGLFWDERYKAILEALANLIVSVILAKRWGILGIVAGTLISTVAFPFWIEPTGLYRYGLKQSSSEYFRHYFLRLLVTVFVGILTGILCGGTGGTVLGFFVKGVICLCVPNIVFLAVYRRTPEFLFLKSLIGKNRRQTK